MGRKKAWSECLEVSRSLLGLENGAGGCWGCAVGNFPYLIVMRPGLPWSSFHCHTVTAASKSTINFPFKPMSLGKDSNRFIFCQRYFNLGWRRIVKCFPFLKNNLNFGRNSSPAIILWTGPCLPSPPGHICAQPTLFNHQNKQWGLKKKPSPKPTNNNTALPVTRCHSGDLKHKLYIFIF